MLHIRIYYVIFYFWDTSPSPPPPPFFSRLLGSTGDRADHGPRGERRVHEDVLGGGANGGAADTGETATPAAGSVFGCLSCRGAGRPGLPPKPTYKAACKKKHLVGFLWNFCVCLRCLSNMFGSSAVGLSRASRRLGGRFAVIRERYSCQTLMRARAAPCVRVLVGGGWWQRWRERGAGDALMDVGRACRSVQVTLDLIAVFDRAFLFRD